LRFPPAKLFRDGKQFCKSRLKLDPTLVAEIHSLEKSTVEKYKPFPGRCLIRPMQCRRVTDTHTDRQTDTRRRCKSVSRMQNGCNYWQDWRKTSSDSCCGSRVVQWWPLAPSTCICNSPGCAPLSFRETDTN